MNNETLNDQLMVVLECPEVDKFDPAPAVHM